MFGIDDAIIASAAAAAIGGGSSIFGQHSANAANRDISNKQMAFQDRSNKEAMAFSERMSDTSWQRGIADMRAAGINPMLAVSKGGASAPTGVSSAGAGIPMQNAFSNVPQSISSAMQLARLKVDLDNARTQNKQMDSQIQLNKQNASTAKQLANLYGVNALNASLDTPSKANDAAFSSTKYGKMLPYFTNTIGAMSPAVSMASTFKNIFSGKDSWTHMGKKPFIYNKRTGEVK